MEVGLSGDKNTVYKANLCYSFQGTLSTLFLNFLLFFKAHQSQHRPADATVLKSSNNEA